MLTFRVNFRTIWFFGVAAVILAAQVTGALAKVSFNPGPHILTPKSCEKPDSYVVSLLLSRKNNRKNQARIRGALFRVASFNLSGGFSGPKGNSQICLTVFDDNGRAEQTEKNVAKALENKRLVAMIGLASSSNAQGVMAMIGASGVPVISDVSIDRLFADYSNIFTMSRSVTSDTQAFSQFLSSHFKSTMFVGVLAGGRDGAPSQPDLFAAEFLTTLAQRTADVALRSTRWIEKADETTLDRIVEDIRQQKPDVLCLAVWTRRAAKIVQRLAQEGISIPIFFATGSIVGITRNTKENPYKGQFFQIGGNIPNLVNQRLAKLNKRLDILLLRRDLGSYLGDGLIYADLVSMIAAAVPPNSSPAMASGSEKRSRAEKMRREITAGLAAFREGYRVFPGMWRNWSFTQNRASARNAFVLWAPDGASNQRLWREQYLRSNQGLRKIAVAYISVDLVRIHSIDTNDQTFDAEFYLSLSSNTRVELDKFAFSNAVKGGVEGRPLVYVKEIGSSVKPIDAAEVSAQGTDIKLYSVKGRFRFNPKLSQYPFDAQRFSVDFKPVDTAHPFLIQPPEPNLLDREADVNGWVLAKGATGQYVGQAQDIITTVHKHGTERQIQPYYKFNFTWVAKRQTLDYYVRVVIPLALIMLVAYFSVFLPTSEVESAVGMQVTSLLATIALYFSIPKLNTETATLSDQIFVFAESVVVLLIMISILRVNLKARPVWFGRFLKGIQVVIFPILVVLMFRYVNGVSTGNIKPLTESGLQDVLCRLLPSYSDNPQALCGLLGV